jgi:hypothetical protein
MLGWPMKTRPLKGIVRPIVRLVELAAGLAIESQLSRVSGDARLRDFLYY